MNQHLHLLGWLPLVSWVVYVTVRYPGTAMLDPRYVLHPERPVWGPLRFFDNREWTAEGLCYRRLMLRNIVVALLLVPVCFWLDRALAP